MELDHAILADVVTPRPDGKVDIHGVGWDTIFAPQVPATHPRMDLLVRFLLSSEETEAAHRVVVTLIGEDGEQIARLQGDLAPLTDEQRGGLLPGRRIGIGMTLTFAGLVFPRYGDYSIVITWDGTEARESMRLFVSPLPSPSA